MLRKRMVLIGLFLAPFLVAHASDEVAKSITEGSVESRVDVLSSIQPGLGVVMHEFGYRFANIYWAANGGNWGLAQYQLKELRESQEVAEITRPQRAGMLKAFESTYLLPLGQAILNKNTKTFNEKFSETEIACNACHTALGYGFIKFKVPKTSEEAFLDFTLKTDPKL